MITGILPADGVVLLPPQPLGMAAGHFLIQPRGKVDGRFHPDLVGRLDLRAEKVKMQVGVLLVGGGRVIGPSVMALGKNGYGIDVPQLQGPLELLLRERGADAGDLFAGVEIQMDLTEVHGQSSRDVISGIFYHETAEKARERKKNISPALHRVPFTSVPPPRGKHGTGSCPYTPPPSRDLRDRPKPPPSRSPTSPSASARATG